ncbi:MAG: hypothetical protein U1F41_03065 [Burkholderiales bacterium]
MKLDWSYQDFPEGSEGTIGPASTGVIAVAECERGGFAITGLAEDIDTPDDDEPALLHIWEGGPVARRSRAPAIQRARRPAVPRPHFVILPQLGRRSGPRRVLT